jgi:prepilin-type N-terminal cleavage/methylation domain-containing protein
MNCSALFDASLFVPKTVLISLFFKLKDREIMLVRHFRRTLTDRGGFSLAEILVAIVVFGILASIAAPQFLAFGPRNRLNGAARQLYSELMWARSKAVNDNSAYTVTFPTNQTMQIAGSMTRTINIQAEYSDVTFSSSASSITFSSRGTTDVAPTITLTNSSGTKTVTVRVTGTASIS